MTEKEVLAVLRGALPTDKAQSDDIAGGHLKKAILKLGRMKGVDFNRDIQTFALTANQKEYVIGKDILNGVSGVWDMDELYLIDKPNWPVKIVGIDRFDVDARGSTTTGVPVLATVHSSTATLEVWPSPDSAYNMKALVRKVITNFDDIPVGYHDVLIDYGLASIAAASAPAIAVQLAQAGLADVQADSRTSWEGSTIALENHLGDVGRSTRVDSGNLRP